MCFAIHSCALSKTLAHSGEDEVIFSASVEALLFVWIESVFFACSRYVSLSEHTHTHTHTHTRRRSFRAESWCLRSVACRNVSANHLFRSARGQLDSSGLARLISDLGSSIAGGDARKSFSVMLRNIESFHCITGECVGRLRTSFTLEMETASAVFESDSIHIISLTRVWPSPSSEILGYIQVFKVTQRLKHTRASSKLTSTCESKTRSTCLEYKTRLTTRSWCINVYFEPRLLFVCSAPSHSVYLLVISSAKLLKVIWNFLHGWFSRRGFNVGGCRWNISPLRCACFRLRGLQNCLPRVQHLPRGIIGVSLCLSIIGRWWTERCLFHWF